MEKVAIVTGANKGLGLAVVKGLCKKFSGTVYLTARDKTRGEEAVKRLNLEGFTPEFHLLDVSSSDSIKQFADFIKNKHGGFDVLVNNAAIMELDETYPSYEAAKRNVDINYKSLLKVEEFLYPLLRDGARVVNVSSACGHLSNLKRKEWIDMFLNKDLSEEEVNNFVDNYLESVRNGTFNKNDFADEGKHAEHRVSKTALTALTMIQQRKYIDRNISINAVHPGHVKTDMSQGTGDVEPDKAADVILYLILEASVNLKGTFMWHNGKLIDWYDPGGEFYFTCPW